MEIEGRIAQANGRLKSSKVGITIEVAGGKLLLRGTLPPKPGSRRDSPYQQRLSTGLPANPNGLRQAEKEARKIGALLACREFSWDDYIRRSERPRTIESWVERLEKDFFDKGGSETTWTGDYFKALKKLDFDRSLDPKHLREVILLTKPNTKTRKRCCFVFGKLLELAGQDERFSDLAGSYSPNSVDPRTIPSDVLIQQHYNALTNPGWKWVYGVMATYGLRNHEAFHLDLSQFPILMVEESTKTGWREVWPCFPEWATKWELRNRILPNIDLGRDNSALGRSVTEYLSPKLPFVPYDLRHAWAIRTSLFGWPVELAAKQMGHSVEVHVRTYHRWLNRQHQQKVFDLLVMRPDRPLPPSDQPSVPSASQADTGAIGMLVGMQSGQ